MDILEVLREKATWLASFCFLSYVFNFLYLMEKEGNLLIILFFGSVRNLYYSEIA